MQRHAQFVILCAVLIGALLVTPAQAINSSDGPNIPVSNPDSSGIELAAEMAIAESTATKLNAPLVTDGNVGLVRISPDNRTVVYRADQDTNNKTELYSVPIGGGTVTKLNAPLVSGGPQRTRSPLRADRGTPMTTVPIRLSCRTVRWPTSPATLSPGVHSARLTSLSVLSSCR